MSVLAFWLIIFSAALHASWNLLAKKSHMTVPFYAIICSVTPPLLGHILFWTSVPLSELPASFWLWVFCTVASDMTYCCGLMMTYRYFDMSSAYPVMRSLPILLTVFVTWLFGIGKSLTPLALLGMAVVFCGCMMMPLAKFRDFSLRQYMKKSMFFVLLAACGTTGYTLGDSEGQRVMRAVAPLVSDVELSLTYYAIRDMSLASGLWIVIALLPKLRGQAVGYFNNRQWLTPVVAGFFAMGTYILVLIAMNNVDNPSYVQVLRQMGLPIGMAFGVIFLKEKCTLPKIIGVLFIMGGLGLTMI